MAYIRPSSSRGPRLMPIVTVTAIAAAFLIIIVIAVMQNLGDIRSKASRNDFLTAGDDALSLQQDLRNLEKDATVQDDKAMNLQQ